MVLEQAILNQSEAVDIDLGKVSSALLTLRASRRFQKDKLTHGLHRVDLYVEDINGDWLENWDDEDEQTARWLK
jgi:hypothetical protein